MIPKIIHLCWLSGDEYPSDIKYYISTWKEKLPDYEIKIWSKDTFDISSVRWVKEAFEAKKYAFAADYIRFWSLYNYGGLYLDSDVEVLKSFDEFLNQHSFIGFEYLNIPEAAVIGAEKGTTWIKHALDWYKDKSFFYENGEMKKDVCPILTSLALKKDFHMNVFDTGKVQKIEGISFYPYTYFSPKNYFTGKVKIKAETVCIHRFASAWGPNEKRKWTLIVHSICIALIGKKFHDRLYKFIKKTPIAFNGDTL